MTHTIMVVVSIPSVLSLILKSSLKYAGGWIPVILYEDFTSPNFSNFIFKNVEMFSEEPSNVFFFRVIVTLMSFFLFEIKQKIIENEIMTHFHENISTFKLFEYFTQRSDKLTFK